MKKFGILTVALGIVLMTGCTFNLNTTRNEVGSGMPEGSRVTVTISDANLGGGEQAYVNASIIAQLKASSAATMVGAGENLSINVELLPAHFISRWYTGLTLGFLKLYYQLGSVRVVNRDTGKILAVHEIVLTGRRTEILGLAEYQTLVLPAVVKLIGEEMGTQGLAQGPTEIDVSEDLVAMD